MNARGPSSKLGTGFTLLEILITLIILAVGMLGLANLQSKIHVTEIESYQRAHAVLLMQDMVDRLNSNRNPTALARYAGANTLGTATAEDCSAATLAAIAATNGQRLAATDRCQWSSALLGASERRDTNGDGVPDANAGGMIGARGCIVQVQAPNPAAGVCSPGIYRVTVAWQGLHRTAKLADACGKDLYGADEQRRAISQEVSIGTPTCASP